MKTTNYNKCMKRILFLFSLLIVTMTMQAASVIRNEVTATAGQWICFRKTITVSTDKPSVNVLRIAADSKYWLWVNGKEEIFEGQLKRGPNASDTYLDTLSLKHLKTGNNTIAVLVWYFGCNGFSHKSSGCPGLYFDLTVGNDHFDSDESWLTKIHPAYYVPSGDTPNFRLPESNVGFDARKNHSGWTSTSFDDSSWGHATAVSIDNSGWGNFIKRPIPYWKDFGEKSYVSMTASSSNIVCKLPYNAQITPCLTVKAKAGLTIGIKTDDYQPTRENSVRAEYITKDGLQSYESLGWMNGHEVIYTIPEGVEVVSLGYRETGYDCELAGSFTCDNADLNSLWKKAQRTLYLTMRDNFMDCPDRERAQWIGDFGIELEEIFYALSPKANLLSSKCLHEFASWQRTDGILHAPVPEGNYDVELPQQCLAAMGLGAWNYYIGTADSKTIRDIFPAWKRYMHIWEMGSNNLVTYRSGGWDWGDWGSNQDMQALCQFWYSVALDNYARQADLVGESSEAEWARGVNAKMKPALQSALWTGEAYRHSSYTGSTDDRTQAMAVLSGVADSTRYTTLHNILMKTQYASPYMERFVLEALCQMGYVDDAISRMHTRYQPMIDSENTTLWELFTLSGGTYNHAWSGGPLIILSKYVAGVQPLEAGFKKFLVRPQLGSLHHVETVVPSVNGNISVKAKDKGYLTLEVTVPEGTTAVLSVSSKYVDISLNNKSTKFSLSADGKFKETTVKSGTYVVKARVSYSRKF